MNIYLEEYSTQDSVKKYTKMTAGHGINFLLENVYGPIYLDIIDDILNKMDVSNGLRILEFGCGGGMNLIYLINKLSKNGIPLDIAYGTDFSSVLIEAAKNEAKEFLDSTQIEKVNFFVASNENLINDLSKALGKVPENLLNSFHFVFGINTIRYCHRLKKEKECSENIFNLLTKGGTCIIIDMNRKFPFFRSRFRDKLSKTKDQTYLPTLSEYTQPFEKSGFDIITKKNFCWVPHSARGIIFFICKLLDLIPEYAMRSLVISRKSSSN
ncbi:MAG: class I SAM-dependent methyltransferase [Promethearchaeota archaeon]